MNELTPRVGQWYLKPDGLKFEVIDIDDGDGMIEVQDQDGTLDEIDAMEWKKIDLELASQPENATAPFDNVPLPDEADGGDPVELEAAVDPIRVANEERVNDADIDDAEDDLSANRSPAKKK